MIGLAAPSQWHLDDNGVSIMANGKEHVVDLHQECIVEKIIVDRQRVVINFAKTTDYTNSDSIKLGAKFSLIIDHTDEVDLPNFDYPIAFEGIYDYKDDTLSLCIGEDICYRVAGNKLQLTIDY